MTTRWTKRDGRQCLDELSIKHGLPANAYEAARLHLLELNGKTASPTQIAKGLAVLTAVCAKPADFDDAKVVLWSERLKQVLAEYPGDVALAMISEWPQAEGGKWWPTEKEVRDECDHRMKFRNALHYWLEEAERASRFAETPCLPSVLVDGLGPDPVGATAAYVSALWAMNPGIAERYLQNARYGQNTIGIRQSMAGFSLERAAPGLLEKHGVKILAPRRFDEARNVVEWGT